MYQDLLKNIAVYGYGVFSFTMIVDKKERDKFWLFCKRNPEYFQTFPGRSTDFSIKMCTRRLVNYLGIESQVKFSQAGSWASLFDILLVNSYMNEVGSWISYSAMPNQVHLFSGKKVSICSQKFGFVSNPEDSDVIVCSPRVVPFLQKNNPDFLEKIEEKIYVPRSVEHIRPRFTTLSI